MKLNLMGFSIAKKTKEFNEVGTYNVTTSYNNLNNNPFFTMCYSNDADYLMKEDCIDDKIDDHDIDNYKIKRWLFKSSAYTNFYALDRANYLYPFEYKHRYHVSIENYFKDGRNEKGLFIITERKIGNPNYNDINNKSYLPPVFRNVINGRTYKIGVSGDLIDDCVNDTYKFRDEISKDGKMRSWRNVLNYYINKPELLSATPDVDIDIIKKVHGIYNANIPGANYSSKEKKHVSINKISENTLSFIEIEFIPYSKLKEPLYLPDHDLYIIPENQLTSDVVHPYSREGMERKKFEESLKEEAEFVGDNKFEVTIYSQSHWLNNMCFFLNVLGEETTIVPKKADLQGKTNYILVKKLEKNIPVTKEYELNYDNLKKLGISLNDNLLLKEKEKEKIENSKINLELEKIKLSYMELENKKEELSYYKETKLKELETKRITLASELKLQNIKIKQEMFKIEKELEVKVYELKQKELLINKAMETEELKHRIEELKYKKEKLTGFASSIGNGIKLLDSLEFFVSKYIFKV